MKPKLIFFLLAAFVLLTASFVTAGCKKPKMAGTSWKMHYEAQAMDDGPSIKCDQVLTFNDETNVELVDVTERSGYSASYMNPDGTVNYTPGSTSKEKTAGTYVVKDDVVEITFDGKTEKYYLHGRCLLCETTPEEYKEMKDYERDFVTFKRIK